MDWYLSYLAGASPSLDALSSALSSVTGPLDRAISEWNGNPRDGYARSITLSAKLSGGLTLSARITHQTLDTVDPLPADTARLNVSLSGENTRAMVMTRAVREMSKLGEAIGGQRDTFSGLAGMGDLIVTCTSQRSRNRRVGEELGSGKPIAEILAGMTQVAEGVKAASVIMEFAEKYGINMPIAREVDAVVNHNSTVEQAYEGLMAEKPGHEVDGTRF
jgi:hypothetical protein